MSEENNNQPPHVNEDELKMPVESVYGNHDHESPSHLGPVLGVLIVILVLILGGLYLWGSTLVNETLPERYAEDLPQPRMPSAEIAPEPTPGNADARADVNALETVSTSDEIDAIEADLEATDLDSLDAELDAIDAELEAAVEAI